APGADAKVVHYVSAVAFSPDGRRLAAATRSDRSPGRILLWDVETGRLERDEAVERGDVLSVRFSTDGRRLVAADSGLQSVPGDPKPGVVVREEDFNDEPITPLRSGDLRVMKVRDFDKLSRGTPRSGVGLLWDWAAARPPLAVEHSANVGGAADSPDGRRLATVGDDGTLRLWDSVTGEQL